MWGPQAPPELTGSVFIPQNVLRVALVTHVCIQVPSGGSDGSLCALDVSVGFCGSTRAPHHPIHSLNRLKRPTGTEMALFKVTQRVLGSPSLKMTPFRSPWAV